MGSHLIWCYLLQFFLEVLENMYIWLRRYTWRKLSTKELVLCNCGAGEDPCESTGLQGDQTSQSTLNIHWKDWCWSSNILATWCEELTHWKRPWSEKDWGEEEKGATEDETVGWNQLSGHEFEQTPGDSKGQRSVACRSPRGHKESDMT